MGVVPEEPFLPLLEPSSSKLRGKEMFALDVPALPDS